MSLVEHIEASTFHGRRGAVANAFRYSVDYVLLEPEADAPGAALFARNGRSLASLRDRDHGGAPGAGRGAAWVREVLASHAPRATGRVMLLAQPRIMGHVFNPVSFWLCHDGDDRLTVVIAEVTNTFGERHSYLCHRDDFAPIGPEDELRARKVLHVSPFQPVSGGYLFRFDIRADRIGIRIELTTGNGGLVATLTGRRKPLTSLGILRASLRRPLGSRRVLALIHWQALKLWWRGARYRGRPEPPADEVTR